MDIGLALKDPSSDLVRRIAPLAESQGFTALLFPELSIVGTTRYTGRDPFISAAVALECTDELHAGPGVVGTVFHTPRHLALRAASLMEASAGRFVLGCGVSHRAFAEEIGVAYPESPMDHIRSYLQRMHEVNAQLAFGAPAPIWLAALGDRMAAAGARHADGLLLNWVAPHWVSRTIEHLRSETGKKPTIVVYLRLDTPDRLRRQAESYLTMFDNYARHFSRQGLEDVDQVVAATGVPIDDAGALEARADAYRRAGADMLVLYPADVADARVERFVQATDVRPLRGA